jgi:alkylhydroperoxidase family enzyme
MSRLPLLDADQASGDAATFLRGAPVKLNLFKVLAHAETCLTPVMRLGGAILSRQQLGDRDRELLVLLVARLQDVRYEWTHHVPIARKVGFTEAAIEAIEQLAFDGEHFTPRELALAAFCRQVVETARAEDAVFAALREHLSEREVMEAILAIGYYMTMARVLNVTETEMDADPLGGLKLFELSKV